MKELREQYETETGFNWGREIDGLPFHSLGYCTWLEEKASRDSRQLSAVPEEFYKKSLERISKAVGITDPIVLISMAKNNDQTYVDILVDYIEEIYKKHRG